MCVYTFYQNGGRHVIEDEFKAGRLRFYLEKWRDITQDQNILDTVEHCHIEFCDCHIEFCDGINPMKSLCLFVQENTSVKLREMHLMQKFKIY